MRASITIVAAVALGLVVTGCQTNAEYQAAVDHDLDARLARFNGSTISAFVAQTGLTPVGAYPVGSGRVFVIDGPPIHVTLAATHVTPAVTRTSACRLLVTTAHAGGGNTADDWEIVGIQRSGPCNILRA
ncbi:hypothetical protein [Sinorhizobium meliloti]|uniref:hypothetical protein n=1 Tax=Rhizobium meliloti TaxID=382 RepID=UPI0012966F3E|nr:hypothetical protein [Sinorhizobium meliloti]MQU91748.1 hypothetical protein [Sinorhizobium meliloti]MQV01798.1 hypothetical protein [Sinorhizobium meliloti]